MKSSSKFGLLVLIVVLLGAGWYLVSPAFRSVEVDEASPLDLVVPEINNTVETSVTVEPEKPADKMVKDDFESMSEDRMEAFKAEVEKMEAEVMEKAEVMPAGPQIIGQGDFQPRSYDVSGRALLIQTGDKKILRFEDFETINGPNLHIYLSADLGTDDFIDLGKIKATKGNVNYEIDPSIDTDKYNKVLVWCVPFRVLFSYAQI